MGDFDTTSYIHPQDIDHFYSLKTNRWLLDDFFVHLKRSLFFLPELQTSRRLPPSTNQSPMLSPQFSQSQITKANTKSKYGKNRQKGYDGDDVDADTDEDVTGDANGDADDDAADDADDDVKEECVLLNFRHSDKLTLVSCLSVAKTK